jgi:hypothetical protein
MVDTDPEAELDALVERFHDERGRAVEMAQANSGWVERKYEAKVAAYDEALEIIAEEFDVDVGHDDKEILPDGGTDVSSLASRTYVETQPIAADEVDSLVPDETIGLLTTARDERLPQAPLLDTERLRRGILAFRAQFGHKLANLALVDNGDGLEGVALYPDGNRAQAIVIPHRVRPEERDGDV